MSVIIRLQNLPWSANALDIRNFFRGLSIPEGGVHIVGGELGDAFIAFSTDEDARQAMMLDGGKIKEIQVKLLLSSRSEMHKVIEQARQTVPILTLAAPAPAPVLPAPVTVTPAITPFSAALGSSMAGFGIPGIGNPNEIPQPAVIEPPAPLVSPDINLDDNRRSKEKDRRRSRSRSKSRDRDRKDRKRDRRDRSRSRERRRRDRSRSRERRDRKRDRNNRSRSRERSERSSPRRSHDRRNPNRKSPDKPNNVGDDVPAAPPAPMFNVTPNMNPHMHQIMNNAIAQMQGPQQGNAIDQPQGRFADPAINDAYTKLSELGKKRNPNAFQGDAQNGGGRFQGGRGGQRGGGPFRREGRSRFETEQQQDCCVAIRNAPNHTSYGDVRRFFPFLIDKHGIKMINDNTGRRTGNIFVRFCDPRSKQLALQRKSNELKGETVVVEPLDDETYESAVDSFLPFRDDNNVEEENQPRAAPQPVSPVCSVLRLSELPNFVKEHDIIKMFSDFSLLSIMLNDCRLTRTKTAYVQFAKTDDARMAFERRSSYLFGKRVPVISPITDDEYEKEKNIQNDKIDFPNQKETPAMEPEGPRDPRQRRLDGPQGQQPAPGPGQPPVPFFSAPFVQQQGPFAGNFGSQFSGFPGNGNMDPRTAAANWANRPGFPNQAQPQMPAPGPDMEELDCVLMKGLPCDATDRTIVTFLSDTGAVPARIHLMLDPSGVPSGDCFCEFRSSSEARRAAGKHGQNLDGCRVTVDLVPRGVVEEALEGPKQPDHREALLGNGPPHGNGPHGSGPPGTGPHGNGPHGNGPHGNGPHGNGPHGNGPHGSPQFFDGPRGAKRGGFRGRGGFDRGGYDGGFDRGGFRGGFDRGRGSWPERGRGGYDRGRGRGRGRARGRGGFDNGRDMRPEPQEDDSALEDFGAPGCVLSLENVPFRATVDDILAFFGDFELTHDDVIRRYNERGQATGDARVAFRTPFDAQRALNTRQQGTIQDRRVNLSML